MHPLFFTMPLTTMLMIMWVAFIVDSISRGRNDYGILTNVFGLHPRSPVGIIGIITHPLLHGSLGHLTTNSGGFIVLGLLIAVQGWSMFVFVTIALTAITGLFLWLFSPNSVIGASGVIFGYLGYLLAFGMTVDGGLPLLAGFIGLVTYGYIWTGIFPSDPRISWLAHAAGFACGLALGHYLGERTIALSVYG